VATVNVSDADRPGATVPTDTGPDGDTVHPAAGAASDSHAERSGARVGFRSVSVSVNETRRL
jgi:hypothetical protein